MAKCRGLTAAGKRCRAPEHLVRESGFCDAHSPGASERMAARAKIGGAATARRFHQPGLAEDELGRLVTLDDCKRYLEVVAKAVATRRLSDRQALAIVRSVEAWIRANGEVTTEQLREIKSLADEVKKQHKLRAVR